MCPPETKRQMKGNSRFGSDRKLACSLDAISGTTPPYFRCICCVEVIADNISPFLHIALAVSSQDVSIPKTINSISLLQSIQYSAEINPSIS